MVNYHFLKIENGITLKTGGVKTYTSLIQKKLKKARGDCINRELNGLWVMHPQDPKNYTPKELYQEYLKTKENV